MKYQLKIKNVTIFLKCPLIIRQRKDVTSKINNTIYVFLSIPSLEMKTKQKIIVITTSQVSQAWQGEQFVSCLNKKQAFTRRSLPRYKAWHTHRQQVASRSNHQITFSRRKANQRCQQRQAVAESLYLSRVRQVAVLRRHLEIPVWLSDAGMSHDEICWETASVWVRVCLCHSILRGRK